MISKKIRGLYVLAAVGFILIVTGIVLVILFSESQGIMKTFPFICLGIGAGSFSGGLGGLISYRRMQQNPQLAKEKQINTKDERNIIITYRAKAMSYNLTIIIFAFLIMFLAMVQVETYITLIFTGAYILIIFLHFYFFNKYYKEM